MAMIAPQVWPSTMIGAPTADRNPALSSGRRDRPGELAVVVDPGWAARSRTTPITLGPSSFQRCRPGTGGARGADHGGGPIRFVAHQLDQFSSRMWATSSTTASKMLAGDARFGDQGRHPPQRCLLPAKAAEVVLRLGSRYRHGHELGERTQARPRPHLSAPSASTMRPV